MPRRHHDVIIHVDHVLPLRRIRSLRIFQVCESELLEEIDVGVGIANQTSHKQSRLVLHTLAETHPVKTQSGSKV